MITPIGFHRVTFYSRKNPAAITAVNQMVSKGNIGSRVRGLGPLFGKKKEPRSLITSRPRSKVNSVSAASGPIRAVFGSLTSLLVQSYYTLPKGRGRSLRESLRSVVFCDQAFDMRQFLMEVLASLFLFPIARKLFFVLAILL